MDRRRALQAKGRPKKAQQADKKAGKVVAQLTTMQRQQLQDLMAIYRSPSLSHTMGLAIEDAWKDYQEEKDRDSANDSMVRQPKVGDAFFRP